MPSTDSIVLSGMTATMGSPTTVFGPKDTRLSGARLTGPALIKPAGASADRAGVPTWAEGLTIQVGMVEYYAGRFYQALKAHTTSNAVVPMTNPAFWKVL